MGMKVSREEKAWLHGHGADADAYPTPSGDKDRAYAGADIEGFSETPTKRPRRPGTIKVEKYGSDGEGDGESSVSDFADAV